MTKKYNVEELNGSTIIWYEENGYRVSFAADESNTYYQRYLRWLEDPTAEESGTLS